MHYITEHERKLTAGAIGWTGSNLMMMSGPSEIEGRRLQNASNIFTDASTEQLVHKTKYLRRFRERLHIDFLWKSCIDQR